MKVKIEDLKPNPYRDISNYPINEEKVATLVASMEQTGFWDNILARNFNGEIQIAYGHHRLMALKKVMSPSAEVEIPVKELDDATMLRIMANENMEQWQAGPGVIDETVRVAKKYLEEHPEEAKKLNFPTGKIGVEVIAGFLGWPKTRVGYAIERISLINDKILDRETIENIRTENQAREYVKLVKKRALPVDKQKVSTKKVKAEGMVRDGIRDDARVEKSISPIKKQKKDGGKKEFGKFIKIFVSEANLFSNSLTKLIEYKGAFDSDYYHKALDRNQLNVCLKMIRECINNLIGEEDEVENEPANTNSNQNELVSGAEISGGTHDR